MSTTPYTFSSKGDFTTLHFSHFNLPPNDAVIIYAASMGNSSTADNPVSAFTYRGDQFSGDFFAATLPANIVNIELVTKGPADAFNASLCKGFKIDTNFNTIRPANNAKSNLEEVCNADNSQEAPCFGGETEKSVAMASVLRLVIKKSDGSYFCTGWLLGSEGHVMTNHHCIGTAQEASDTEFEFNAYGANCQVNCKNPRGCGGQVFDRSKRVEFITTNPDLDYTLVRLQSSWPRYLTMRESGAVLNENIYIPQHPSGWGMRIAAKSDDGAPGSVTSLTTSGCAVDQVAYDLDTRAGSSGSPIISTTDNSVIALHHCGGCPNTAINGYKIINDLRAKGVLPRNAVYSAPTPAPTPAPTTTPPPVTPAPTPKPTPVPTTQAPAPALAVQAKVDGTIFATGSTTTVDYIDFTVSADADVELDILSMEEVSNASGANSYADVNGDCNAGYIDSKIILFRLNGNAIQQSDVIAINTDAPDSYGAKDGSVSATDSYMFLRLTRGSYRLAVGTSAMSKADAVSKTNGAARLPRVCNARVSNYGSYRLTVSATAGVQVASPGSYIGSQCSVPNAVQVYAACPYHKEAALMQAAVVDGTIVRKASSVTVDHIPFTVSTFGRVAIEVSSYGTANGVTYVDLNGHCVSAYIDPVVYLFRTGGGGGLQAADMINAGDDDENFAKRTGRHSINFRDPFFSLALPPGDYVLAVGRYPLSVDEAIAKAGRSSVDKFTPESCGVASAEGNYIVTFGSAVPLPMAPPGTFRGSKCPPDTSKSICPR
ncbi:hypothetical protein PybrP1_003703 [[Pythium] brassicae (nom. inval.)]|nr:hypothetical protein PybrP1_003703 [[Pythium] brassicae (nom. inval.)]